MPHGYTGNILHINLSTGTLEVEHPDEAFYRQYMGGSALGLYYLLKFTPPDSDAFDPGNTLVLALSVLTGAPISGQSRITAVARSPLSGLVGDAQAGGFFPARMKASGFDAVVIRGKSETPVYLCLDDGDAELRPAEHLWGKDTGQVDRLIKDELGDQKIEIMQCGIAGENMVRFAALMNMSNRAAGRTGMGAVMGSKNIKAVAVRGKQSLALADRGALKRLAKWGADNLESSDAFGLQLLGTAEIIGSQNAVGGLPTRNWQSGAIENWEAIDGKTMSETILKENATCYACVVRCKRVVNIQDSDYQVDPYYGGPEYESISTLGSYCGATDLEAISYANQLCNQYGMDTISCGATIAWALDCFEQGILTLDDTNGLELRFGNADTIVKLVEQIARREGIGDLLAEGSARAASQFGSAAEDSVVAVKGVELPAHMPQVKRSLALIYAVNPFGADHESVEHDDSHQNYPERFAHLGLTNPQPTDVLNKVKVQYAYRTQCLYALMDTLNICHFVYGPSWQLYDTRQLVEVVQAITGWDVDIEELLRVGERRLNMQRAFNAINGADRSLDTLPKRLYEPLLGGASEGMTVAEGEVEKALDQYFALAGWDTDSGNPTRTRLEELNLAWVAEEMGL